MLHHMNNNRVKFPSRANRQSIDVCVQTYLQFETKMMQVILPEVHFFVEGEASTLRFNVVAQHTVFSVTLR